MLAGYGFQGQVTAGDRPDKKGKIDEVVGSRDGCRHSIAQSTVEVPIPLILQIFSARTTLFSCPLA